MKDGTGIQAGEVLVTPRRGALLAGQDNTLDVLVQVRAPDAKSLDEADRPPLGIALVVDRSGSMSGVPLDEAKRCCKYVVGRLRPVDRLSIVQFDGRVEVLRPAAYVTGKSMLESEIDGIESGGNTNLHGGWLAGAEQMAPFAGGRIVQRVILLSDGGANEGVTDQDDIVRQCSELASAGVTTSTYGLGRNFNEALMTAMAEAGHGNSYYGATAEDLFEPFNREFDLLANLWMRSVVLTVRPAPGVEVRMLNQYSVVEAGQRWRLPDIGSGAEAWALLRLRVPAACVEDGRGPLLEVEVEGVMRDGATRTFGGRLREMVALPGVAYGAVAENADVVQRADELDASELLLQCRTAALVGDWATVDALLAQAAVRFASSPWVSGVIDSMKAISRRRERESSAKDLLYTSRTMSRRLRSTTESTGLEHEMDTSSYMRRRTSEGTAEFIKSLEERE